jgi:hypothetical protein
MVRLGWGSIVSLRSMGRHGEHVWEGLNTASFDHFLSLHLGIDIDCRCPIIHDFLYCHFLTALFKSPCLELRPISAQIAPVEMMAGHQREIRTERGPEVGSGSAAAPARRQQAASLQVNLCS